jgi:protein-S-isoprenylcysteine O-methyltransferase Ste14
MKVHNNMLPSNFLIAAASILTIAQFILAFFLHGPESLVFEWIGWICLWTAGIFGIVPILTFRKYGNVPEGKSYIQTTRLVTNGVYSIVRHPQNGTSWMLINLGMMLITRHWSSFGTGTFAMLLAYLDTYNADQRCLEKFSNEYRQYIMEVPRINFLFGIFLMIRRKLLQ